VVFSSLLGTDPLGDPGSCRVDTLAQLYVDGPTYSLTPAPANLDLSRRKVRARCLLPKAPGAAAIEMRQPCGHTTARAALSQS
jgi:hypothetical protein